MTKQQQAVPSYNVYFEPVNEKDYQLYRELGTNKVLVCECDTRPKAVLIAELLKEREEYDRQTERGHDNNYVPWDS